MSGDMIPWSKTCYKMRKCLSALLMFVCCCFYCLCLFAFLLAALSERIELYNGPLLCGFNVPIKGLRDDDIRSVDI